MADVGFEEAVLTRILGDIDSMVDAAASTMGMPPGGKQYTQQEIDTEWNYSPIADPAARMQTMMQLKMSGRSDEEITDMVYPNRRRLITTGRPRVPDQIRFAQQQDRRMAKLLAEYQQQMQPDPLAMAAQPPLPDPVPQPLADPMAAAPSPTPTTAGSMLDQPISMMGG